MTIFRLLLGFVFAIVSMTLIGNRVYSVRRDFDVGLRLNIFQPGSIVRWRIEGDGLSRWTSHGIRRQSLLTSTNALSILVLGDSFTEALQVNDDQVYTSLLENQLSAAGFSISILNAAHSGDSVADYVGRAEAYQKVFAPGWVIVQVTEDDFLKDAWSDSKAHFYRSELNSELKVALPPSDSPIAERTIFRRMRVKLFNHWGLLEFSTRRLGEFQNWIGSEPPLFRAASHHAKSEEQPRHTSYPIDEEFMELVNAYHGRLTLLLLTRFDAAGCPVLSSVASRLQELARQTGISCVTPDSEYFQLARRGFAPYGFSNSRFNKGHLNPEGHQIVAKVLSQELKKIAVEHAFH